MKFKAWYVLLWAVLVGGIGSLSNYTTGYWNENSWIGTVIHVGVPIIIYVILRRREKKQKKS